MEICGDNRFEIIAKAKAHLLDATNIDTAEDEMKVLDNFLFRCWQMGWLDRYDEQTEPQNDDEFKLFDREMLILLIECQKERIAELLAKTEPNCSEKPNNCDTCRNKGFEGCEQPCLGCGCCGLYEPKDEPSVSEMPTGSEPQKWETPPKFEHKGIQTTCVSVPACLLEIEDEPQTERSSE